MSRRHYLFPNVLEDTSNLLLHKSMVATSKTLLRHATRVRALPRNLSLPQVLTPMSVLRLEPSDPDALQTKLALLLHTEQYAPALALAESLSSDTGPTMFALEFGRAYALYRLNCESAAGDVVRRIQPAGDHEERGVLHMEAQIVCRPFPEHQI